MTERSAPRDDVALEAGLALARAVAADAIWDADLCAFHGAAPDPTPGRPARWRVFAGGYYDGSAGIARTLAYAAALSDDAELVRTARGALAHALAYADGWSLHSGLLGAGLVAVEIGHLWGDPGLDEAGREACLAAVDAASSTPGPVALDLIAGLAGVLHACTHLAQACPETWRPRAEAVAERLAAAGVDDPVGRRWPMHQADPVALCGLAHGASGVALAFEAFAPLSVTPERWHDEAAAARRFERTHFDAVAWSWADLRGDGQRPSGGPSLPHFWCHGSIGVAQERLLAHRRHPNDVAVAADLAAALAAARREAQSILAGPAGPGAGFGSNASQCHGASGIIDLLVETGEAHDLALARALAAFVRLDARRPEGYRCGNPGGEPAPGLMVGLAGIAWGQLRAAAPHRVPRAWTPTAETDATGAEIGESPPHRGAAGAAGASDGSEAHEHHA